MSRQALYKSLNCDLSQNVSQKNNQEEIIMSRGRISLMYQQLHAKTQQTDRIKAVFKKAQIESLFSVTNLQLYQLDYLYRSEHYGNFLPYRQLVQLLQKFNEEASFFNNQETMVDRERKFSPIKLVCMKFIYHQMLVMAVMQHYEMKQTNLAEKLFSWYHQLGSSHSFLEGVKIDKKDNKGNVKLDNDEIKIRASYISNVFDQIDDYLRKKLDHSAEPFKEQVPVLKDNLNLPLIDSLIYKRQDAKLREKRQKEYDQHLINNMINQRNKIRESSLRRLQPKYNGRASMSNSLYKSNKMPCNTNNKIMPISFYRRDKTSFHKQNIATNNKSILQKMKLTQPQGFGLCSISGLNLINNRFQ